MATNTGRRTYDTLRVFIAHRLRYGQTYHLACATDMGKQGELNLCPYLHIGIGLAAFLYVLSY